MVSAVGSSGSERTRGALGAPVVRKDAGAKILGEARYVDDLVYPGMLHGATVRTRSAGGTIERIECGPGFDWSSFVVVTAADVPGINATQMIEQDQPVLASVDAELSADGAAPPHFKVREYNGVWPKETCVQAGTPPPLENTYWKLTRLDGKPVMTPANAREAYVVLKAPNQLTGYAGCNRLGGRYSLKRGELSFRGAVMTRMACLVEQDTESKLMNALKDTSTWSIEGQYLHLFNDEGQQLARFEAVYLR
jgi:heat shock protein HslJ